MEESEKDSVIKANAEAENRTEKAVHIAGRTLAEHLPLDFCGNVRLNYFRGKYVNADMVQSVRPQGNRK